MQNLFLIKKLFFLLFGLAAVLIITGCQKDETVTSQTGDSELSFSITPGKDVSGLKASDCFTQKAAYVKVNLKDGSGASQWYFIDIFYLDNVPYTNSLKLPSGTYTLQEFMMYNDNMTPSDKTDDWVMAAAVHSGALYSNLVTTTLTSNITIAPFKKSVMNVELVCYEETTYSNFGFEYFQLDQTIVREQNFFGDFCIKNLADYANSPYAQQSNGVQYDMPAIFKIELWHNGTLKATYDNSAWHGEGQPLKVTYADDPTVVDNYILKLYILVRQGTSFNYVHFYDWSFADNQKIDAGTDGVVDFALGNCVPSADLIIPPWMNLPSTCTYKISGWQGGSPIPTLGGYVDATLSGISAGYEFGNGSVASWCADHQTTIYVNQSYSMDVYSSLHQAQLPVFAQSSKWDKINWIMNHLDWYPGYKWYDVQGAIWLFDTPAWNGSAEAGVPALSTMQYAQKMHNDAETYGSSYKVPSGGWACVIFVPHGTSPSAPSPTIQTMFIRLDP